MTRQGVELVFEAMGATASDIMAAEAAAWAVFDAARINPWVAAAAAFKQEGELEDLTPEEEDAADLWHQAYDEAKRAFYGAEQVPCGDADLRLMAR